MSPSAIVSVITPTKNRCELLRETLDSVQRQTFAEWEHIIVDDGSNDGTAELIRHRANTDSRIQYMLRTGDKSGANVCRNLGLQHSLAGLIIFLDSDDLLRPNCLERRVEIMKRNVTLDFAVYRAGVFEKSTGDLRRLYHKQPPGDDLLRFLSLECPWQASGPVWRRSFLEKIGGFDETLLSMQDLEMHVRALSACAKYICLRDVDHDIRCQNDPTKTSVRHFTDPAYIRAVERVEVKLFDTLMSNGLLTWSRKRALLGLSFGAAESWVRSRQTNQGFHAWKRGCDQQHAALHIWITGILMLFAVRLGRSEDGLCWRLVNKWKGLARFRQEPLLLPHTDTCD